MYLHCIYKGVEMSFNEAQLSAINHNQGPALVLAGPGSGKTTVITQRIKNLITEYHVSPKNILVITFTKMAANEMKTRYEKLIGRSEYTVTFGTFHAIYFTILKHATHIKAENIIRQDQQIDYIKRLFDRYELDITDVNEYAGQILSEIGRVKNDRIAIDEYNSKICPEKVFRDIYHRLDQMMKRNRLIDFDDMMIECYDLLSNHPDLLEAWRQKYQYILIDEFQDICQAQFDVIHLFLEKRQNIFIVGDDDQSIYGFRGARPDIMLSFEHIFTDCKRINMNTNYRSTANIVNCAKSVIEHNTNRFHKFITTDNPVGNQVQVYEFSDLTAENEFLVEQIMQWKNSGGSLAQCAILTRTNACGDTFTKHLVEKNIKFIARETVKCIFSHWIWLDICSYIQIAHGNRNRSEIFRIMNKPVRYISRDSMPHEIVNFNAVKSYYNGKQWMQQRVDDLLFDLKMIQKLKPYAAVNYIRKGAGYEDFLKTYAKEHQIAYQELVETLDEIHESARTFATFEQWFAFVEEYKEQIAEHNNHLKSRRNSSCTQEGNEQEDAVNICTLHACKGLEFEVVFIMDAIEGMMPYHKAVLEEEIEEERRMFYVAMTRAKKHLNICFTDERYNKEVQMSRFIEEMDLKYTNLHLINKDEKHR